MIRAKCLFAENFRWTRGGLRDISSALQKYSEEPGAKEIDTTVRSNMQILLNLFHDNAKRLQDIKDEMTNGFKDNDVADVNQMLKNIAELNKSIKNSQVLGNPALELMDQRNDLLDQLSSYLPISVTYEKEQIAPGQFWICPVFPLPELTDRLTISYPAQNVDPLLLTLPEFL